MTIEEKNIPGSIHFGHTVTTKTGYTQ